MSKICFKKFKYRKKYRKKDLLTRWTSGAATKRRSNTVTTMPNLNSTFVGCSICA